MNLKDLEKGILEMKAQLDRLEKKLDIKQAMVLSTSDHNKMVELIPEKEYVTDALGLPRPFYGMDIIPCEGLPDGEAMAFSKREDAYKFVELMEEYKDVNVAKMMLNSPEFEKAFKKGAEGLKQDFDDFVKFRNSLDDFCKTPIDELNRASPMTHIANIGTDDGKKDS